MIPIDGAPTSPYKQVMTLSSSSTLPGRGWLVAGGILSMLAGFFAITFPLLASVAVTQLVGALALVTGLMEFFPALFSKKVAHRMFTIVMALVRVVAGVYLLFMPGIGKDFLTLFLGILFLIEGIFCVVAAFKLRPTKGWVWVLLNGIAAFLLGGMIYVRWPDDSDYVIGLLFGINCIFVGAALLALDPKALSREAKPAE
jgi:uncharacterized membrane protein HdeD (DUF308 family)